MSVEETKKDVASLVIVSEAKYPEWFQKFLAESANRPSPLGEEELARRQQTLAGLDAFRAEMLRKYGVQTDSTPMIRAMRDHE